MHLIGDELANHLVLQHYFNSKEIVFFSLVLT